MFLLDWVNNIAREFYVAKGILGLLATIALVCHMARVWHSIHTWAQRLRYISLLYFAVLITGVSAQSASTPPKVQWVNLGGLFGTLLLGAAAVASLVADAHDRKVGQRVREDHLVH